MFDTSYYFIAACSQCKKTGLSRKKFCRKDFGKFLFEFGTAQVENRLRFKFRSAPLQNAIKSRITDIRVNLATKFMKRLELDMNLLRLQSEKPRLVMTYLFM